jgi:hypothetical protein
VFLLVTKEGVVSHPYSFYQLRLDNPQVSFPADPSAELLDAYGVYPVAPVDRPEPSDPITKRVVEGTPVVVNGVWTQTWTEVNERASVVLQNQREALDEGHHTSIKADSFVAKFVDMTPAQVTAYIDANVTNLASSKAVINKLALMVLLLARREFR